MSSYYYPAPESLRISSRSLLVYPEQLYKALSNSKKINFTKSTSIQYWAGQHGLQFTSINILFYQHF